MKVNEFYRELESKLGATVSLNTTVERMPVHTAGQRYTVYIGGRVTAEIELSFFGAVGAQRVRVIISGEDLNWVLASDPMCKWFIEDFLKNYIENSYATEQTIEFFRAMVPDHVKYAPREVLPTVDELEENYEID